MNRIGKELLSIGARVALGIIAGVLVNKGVEKTEELLENKK